MKIFAHKYLYRHEHRRKILRRWAKKGLIELLSVSKEGRLYEVSSKEKAAILNQEKQ